MEGLCRAGLGMKLRVFLFTQAGTMKTSVTGTSIPAGKEGAEALKRALGVEKHTVWT